MVVSSISDAARYFEAAERSLGPSARRIIAFSSTGDILD
jgi:hypothetical protein